MKFLEVFFVLIVISCSSGRQEIPQQHSTTYSEIGKAESEKLSVQKKTPSNQQRILTYKGYITLEIESEQSIEVRKKIIEYIQSIDGYILTESTYSLTLKIPAEKYRPAIEEIRKLGKVKHESFQTEDITEAYYDSQVRLENAQKLQERLLELLKKAKTVQETIEVEKELNRVTSEIELQKSKLFRLENQIQFSILNVNLQEKPKEKKLGPLGWVFYGIYKVVRFLFIIEDSE